MTSRNLRKKKASPALSFSLTGLKKKKRSKYGNKKVVVDGITFDSKKEAKRYGDLKNLQRAGEISRLELQPRYEFALNGHEICAYVADFRYVENGEMVIEDVKSEITRKNPEYRIKNKMMKAFYNISVRET